MYSGEPVYDRHWVGMLAGGISIDVSKIANIKKLVEGMGPNLKFDEPPHHCAEADARTIGDGTARAIAN